MPYKHRSVLVLIALALFLPATLLPATAHAKGWTQPEGDGYAKIWLRGIFGSDAFTRDGEVEASETFQDVSLRHYVEYGLTDQWTLLTRGAPAGFASYGDNSTAYAGPLALGVRRSLVDGPIQLAAEVQYGYAAPAGDDNLADADDPFIYRPTVPNHFGLGEVQAGYDLGLGWIVASAGFQLNSADQIDPAFVGFGQLGLELTDTWVIDAHLSMYEPFGDVEVTNVSGAGQTRYMGFGLGLSWWMTERLGLSANFDGAVYAESNAATPAFGLGVEGTF